eukprot:14003857-Ditylum_brightwellii.AAC.1
MDSTSNHNDYETHSDSNRCNTKGITTRQHKSSDRYHSPTSHIHIHPNTAKLTNTTKSNYTNTINL